MRALLGVVSFGVLVAVGTDAETRAPEKPAPGVLFSDVEHASARLEGAVEPKFVAKEVPLNVLVGRLQDVATRHGLDFRFSLEGIGTDLPSVNLVVENTSLLKLILWSTDIEGLKAQRCGKRIAFLPRGEWRERFDAEMEKAEAELRKGSIRADEYYRRGHEAARVAAGHNCEFGQHALAWSFFEGRGAPKDVEKAAFWEYIACADIKFLSSRNTEARTRLGRYAESLSQEQQARIQREATAFIQNVLWKSSSAPAAGKEAPARPSEEPVGVDVYYPKTCLRGGFSEATAKRTAKVLQAMREPSLAGSTLEPRDQYRFIYLPTFHRPLVVRFWKLGGGAKCRSVRLSGEAGYDPLGPIEAESLGTIPEARWKQIEAGFTEEAVRQPLKGLTEDQINLLNGMDGAEWILEERRGDKHAVTAVWSPPAWERMREKGFDPKEFAKFGLPVPPAGFQLPDLRPFIRQCRLFLDLAGVSEPNLY